MPAVSRRAQIAARIAAALLLTGAFPFPAIVQAQESKPPASTLTAEQEAELDALHKQAAEAYTKGDLKTAERLWQQALEKAVTLKDVIYTAKFLNNLGGVYYNLSQNDKALDYYTRALTLKEKLGNPADVVVTLNIMGLVYYSLGRNDKALDFHTRALALREKIGNPADIASTLNNLGNVSSDLGQNDKALDYYTRALSLYEKVSNLAYIATSLNNLGGVYYSLGQTDKALDCHTRALALREKIGNSTDIAGSLNNLGVVYHSIGQNDKALDYYTRALALKENVGNPADIAMTLNNLGNVYSNLGRLDEAEQSFAHCRQLRETVALQVGDPSQVGALQETFKHFYESYAAFRLARHLPEEALEMLETGRGAGLARQIDLSERGDITHRFTEPERAELQTQTAALRLALVRQRQAAQQAETAPTPQRAEAEKRAAQAGEGAAQATRAYDLFRDGLFARHPELREAAENRPAKFARLKTLARDHPDTLYLEWGVTSDKATLLFALGDGDGLKTFTLPTGERALAQTARQWRAALAGEGGRGVEVASGADAHQTQAAESALAKQAYQELLGEADKAGLLAAGRYKRLVLVGSGPLLEMPMGALCDAQGHRLIERFALSRAFSLSTFFYRANTERPTASLLCVADPTGAREPAPNTPSGKSVPQTQSGKASDTQTGAAKWNASAFRGGFLPLAGARQEGRAVADLFAGSRLLIGPEAREEAVTAQMKNCALLHFATHDYMVPSNAMQSGLVLAEEPEQPEPAGNNPLPARSAYDGLLTARKIVGLPQQWNRSLAAQLAVLSACETGRGTAQGGEGLMGLAWAFRAAGCPSLVASQWAVNDAATRQWMLVFYGALKAGKTKDEAVQAAALAVKNDKTHAAPYFWAAFELIGDASPLPPNGLLAK